MITQANDRRLRTRTGFRFRVRSAVEGDAVMMKDFFAHLTRADLHFRFLSGEEEVSQGQIEALVHPDHDHTDSFVALTENGSTMIATAMLACDDDFHRGEVAIAVRADHKGQGVGWEMLAFVAHVADAKGVKILESIESRDNHEAIELERDMGWVTTEISGDPGLVLVSRSLDPRFST